MKESTSEAVEPEVQDVELPAEDAPAAETAEEAAAAAEEEDEGEGGEADQG